MRNPLKTERSTDIGLLLARIPVGVLLVIAGCNKFGADSGFRGFASGARAMIPSWARYQVTDYYVQAIPFIEVVAGLLIVLGFVTRLGGFLATFLMLSIVVATQSYTQNGLPHPNLVYLGLVVLFFLAGGGSISLDKLVFGKKSDGFAH